MLMMLNIVDFHQAKIHIGKILSMNDIIEAQYDITKVSKTRKFYENNKILIILVAIILVILLASYTFYQKINEDKKIEISEKYIQAKIFIEENENDKATNLLKEIIYSNNSSYSTLSLFLIINENLISDNQKEIVSLFDHILNENKFDTEVRNLLIYKKSLLISDYATESEMLDATKPLLNNANLWQPHALMLLGDYFASKQEIIKAQEFYIKILSNKNYPKNFYDQASLKITNLKNE